MPRFLRRPALGLILGLGLLHGLIYILLVPPWQHYDEPAHFEYAWLLANRPGLPLRGEFDQPMRTEVAASMLKYNFFRGMDLLPDLEARNEAVWIGISQVGDPPLYYLIASLPARLFPSWDVTRLLYAMRFVSLALYLLSIWVAWEMMKELTPDGHVLRWMVPLSMVLLPGYTDLMTAVNNDVGATLLFSLFLWSSMRLIQRGFSLLRFFWAGIAALSCLWMKETVILALPLLGVVLLISLFRNRWRWMPWVILSMAALAVLFTVFSWDDALFWGRWPNTLQENPIHAYSEEAQLGRNILQIETTPNESRPAIFQLIPEDRISALRGKTVTLGAWIWATQPLTSDTLALYDGSSYFSQRFQIETSPKFFSIAVPLAEDASHVRVMLSPFSRQNKDSITVFYDGLVLVEGSHPLNVAPQFDDPSAEKGTWGGISFHNLLRNASGEVAGPAIRPWARELSSGLLHAMPFPALEFSVLLDWRGAEWYYQSVAKNLLNTFWSKFGWGHVPLLPFTDQFYILLQMVVLTGFAGTIIRMLRSGHYRLWNMLLFFGLTMSGILVQTILRGMESLYGEVFIPGARYAYPVIIPFMLALNAGWLEVSHFLARRHLPYHARFWVYALFFLILDIASLWSVFYYYYIR